MGDFFVNVYDYWEYLKVILGYIVSIFLFYLGKQRKNKVNKITAIVLFVLMTLLLITKIFNL